MKVTKFLLLLALCFIFGFTSCEKEENDIDFKSQEQNVLLTEDFLSNLVDEALEETQKNRSSQIEDVKPVDFVDLEKYTGRWFELAKFPTLFNADCNCTTADYGAIATGVSVSNNCITVAGDRNTISGAAAVVDTATNAKLALQFDNIPFPGEYWIIDLVDFKDNTPYDFAVVSDSKRENLFILSRSPKLKSLKDKGAILKILIRLVKQGFDIRKLKISPQPLDCIYS